MFQTMTNSTRIIHSPWFSVVFHTVVELGYRASRRRTLCDSTLCRGRLPGSWEWRHPSQHRVNFNSNVRGIVICTYCHIRGYDVEMWRVPVCTAAVLVPFWAMDWSVTLLHGTNWWSFYNSACLLRSYLHTYLLISLRIYLLKYLRTYLRMYLRTYLFTYLLIYLLIYLHTYILTYLLTYVVTYLLTYSLT